MGRLINFEIPATRPERASEFYTSVFGWKIKRFDGEQPRWLVSTGENKMPGIKGGITIKNRSNSATVNTIDVPQVDECIDKINRAGGKLVAEKMAVTGVGYLAYCKDTEDNIFSIMQMDKTAK